MKVSLNWIKKYTGKLNYNVEDIANRIKESLAEVEHIENLNEKYKGIIIAKIIEKVNHPNADKLGIYKIDIGKKEKKQVVAGDKNLEIGNKVIYLPPNTKLPFNPYPNKFDGIIKTTKLRGVESQGMLASEKELNLSNNHEKVMTLDIDCKPGDSFAEISELNDYILEIENKPLTIRPDTFGIIGLAREISAMFGENFETPIWCKKYSKIKVEETLPVRVDNKLDSLCPRYMAISMKNVKVQESPLWLKSFLSSMEVKSINNVVDITNYLMLLTGQPLHAFDYDKLVSKDIHAKNKALITVRLAKNDEKITTLDGKTVNLIDKTVVICDSQNPIAIGGVMGGMDTEIDENSKNIIIESANFDLYNIKKTSMKLGIFTEAVTRYSKGQDPNLCEPVIHKAVELVQELCEGEIGSNIQDKYYELPKEHKLTFSVKYLNKHLGLELKRDEIINILSRVEIFEIKNKDKDLITLKIPTYRQDLKIPEDIHEEIARIYGFKNIKLTLPKKTLKPSNENNSLELNKRLRNILKSIGCNEILTYNFVGKELYQNCDLNLENNFRLINALSPELEYMRSSLLPSLLEKVNLNVNRGYEEFSIFEINKTHNKLDIDKREKLPKEYNMLSLTFAKQTEHPFYETKFYLNTILKELNTNEISYESLNKINKEKLPNRIKVVLPLFDFNKTAILVSEFNKEKIYLGIIGEPNLGVQKNLKLKKNIGMFEINIIELKKIINLKKNLINYSKFPKIQQDFCFVLKKNIPYNILVQSIENALEKRNINYIIKPVDIYQKEKELKQITVSITIQHKEKTLREKDILSIRELIEKKVLKETTGTLKT